MLDHDGYLPCYAVITDGKESEMKVAKSMTFPPGTRVAYVRMRPMKGVRGGRAQQHGLIWVAAVAAGNQLPLGRFGALVQTLPQAMDGRQTGQRKSALLLLLFVCFLHLGRGVLFRFAG